MKSKFFVLIFLVFFVSGIFLIPQNCFAKDPDIITLAGAGPTGRWFKEMAVFGKILTHEMPGISVNGVTGKGASVGNIKRIAANKLHGGRVIGYDMDDATKKQGLFSEGDYSKCMLWMKMEKIWGK